MYKTKLAARLFSFCPHRKISQSSPTTFQRDFVSCYHEGR
jgi:hypothetical protein